MYKVFLADDEIVIREGIRSSFPWDETDFTLVGEAPDGEIALSMLQDAKPDILITDIRMPFMDGLELCRQVVRSMPWVYIVILSGYDDFSYAREAISLGVKEYLLKPVSGQELLNVLKRIAGRIQQDKRQQANLMAYREQLASSGRYLKEKMLSELYAGQDGERILSDARSLRVNLLAGHYLVMLLKPDRGSADEEKLLGVQSVLERLAEGNGGAVQLLRYAGMFSLLVMGDNSADLEERAYGLAEAARFDVERSTGVKLTVTIGTDVTSLPEIPRSLAAATEILNRLSDDSAENAPRRIFGAQDETLVLEPPDIDARPIGEQLQYADLEDVDALLKRYMERFGASAAQSAMLMNYAFVEILLAASRLIRENGGEPKKVIPAACRAQNRLLTVREAMPLCRDMLQRAIAFRDMNGSARYGNVIRKAKACIAERFTDSNLTLTDVARYVALSNNHFCTVFSQETGMTFTEYLTAVRIQRAKELLATSAMRTSDVAYAVGYNDPHYFSYQFKRNTGLTPRGYRKDEKIGVPESENNPPEAEENPLSS